MNHGDHHIGRFLRHPRNNANRNNNNNDNNNNHYVNIHPLVGVRDRLFHALFYKASVLYAKAVPVYMRQIIEFLVLLQAVLTLFLQVYIHSAIIRNPANCLSEIKNEWPRSGVLRVEVLHVMREGYSLKDSYAKEISIKQRRNIDVDVLTFGYQDVELEPSTKNVQEDSQKNDEIQTPVTQLNSGRDINNIVNGPVIIPSRTTHDGNLYTSMANHTKSCNAKDVIYTFQSSDYINIDASATKINNSGEKSIDETTVDINGTIEENIELSERTANQDEDTKNYDGSVLEATPIRPYLFSEYYDFSHNSFFIQTFTNIKNTIMRRGPPLVASNKKRGNRSAVEEESTNIEILLNKVLPDEDYIVEFALEYGYLRLSPSARRKLNIPVMLVILDPNKDTCFGNKITRFMLEHLVGYDDLLMISVKQLAEMENSKGFLRNVVTGEHYRFVSLWMSRMSYGYALAIMLIFTLAISMLLRYSHHQIFTIIVEVLHTLELNTPVMFPVASLLTVILALVGMEAVMAEFFNDTTTAFYVIIIVWIADQYDSVCSRCATTRRYWLKFFYLYLFSFYAYYYRFNGQFNRLSLLTAWLFIEHSMIYFFHHFELPMILQQEQIHRVLTGSGLNNAATRDPPDPNAGAANPSTEAPTQQPPAAPQPQRSQRWFRFQLTPNFQRQVVQNNGNNEMTFHGPLQDLLTVPSFRLSYAYLPAGVLTIYEAVAAARAGTNADNIVRLSVNVGNTSIQYYFSISSNPEVMDILDMASSRIDQHDSDSSTQAIIATEHLSILRETVARYRTADRDLIERIMERRRRFQSQLASNRDAASQTDTTTSNEPLSEASQPELVANKPKKFEENDVRKTCAFEITTGSQLPVSSEG